MTIPRRLYLCTRSCRLAALLIALTAAVLCAAQDLTVDPGRVLNGPITITTSFAFPEDPITARLESIWLAGLTTQQNAARPDVLGLVWTLDSSSWVPVWSLRLESPVGLLPAELPHRRSADSSGAEYVTLANLQPQWGTVYETNVSYDPESGRLSVWIADAVSHSPVYADVFDVPPLEVHAFAMAGYVQIERNSGNELFTPITDIRVLETFVPRAVTWYLAMRTRESVDTTGTTLVDRSGEGQPVLVVKGTAPTGGSFRFFAEGAGERILLATVPAAREDQIVELPLEQLPLGAFRLVMEYAESGEVRFRSAKDVTVGKVNVQVSPVHYNRSQGAFAGQITLNPDAPMNRLRVRTVAEILEMNWNETTRRYDQELQAVHTVLDDVLALDTGGTDVPIRIPAPQRPGLWQLRFYVTTEPAVTVVLNQRERLATTYSRPELGSDEPFTIAIIPDTQKYAYVSPSGGYPDIFIRQFQWLAEHAAAENIALVLHVGDLTQHNTVSEWEVAQKSIYLLDDVIPYVLAIGNHDMGTAGTGNDRSTLFNSFFPVSRYATQPWFGGTFEPGRLENSYSTFSFGGQEFLVVSLEFLPRDAVLAWASEVVASHPNHNVIVVTHRHVGADGLLTASPGSWDLPGLGGTNAGVDVWNKFLKLHPNIRFVFSGHVCHDAVPRGIRRGVHGNAVFDMLSDFSCGPNGGAGWLVLLRFFPPFDRAAVTVYSPFLDATKYDDTDGFFVPFCIDLDAGRYTAPDAACSIALK